MYYTNLVYNPYIELLGCQDGYYHPRNIEGVWCYAIKEMKDEGKTVEILDDNLCCE